MLDLNVDVISADSSCDENETGLEDVGTPTDDSGTPNSSVVNDEDSSSTHSKLSSSVSALNFGIVNRGTDNIGNDRAIKYECDDNSASRLVTMQLFPAGGDGGIDDMEAFDTGWSFVSQPQWLNLSVADSEVPVLKTFQQQKPQQKPQPQPQRPPVKKSRRGPRSRSSQYRGVTFYRRTGRWESHIWDCGKQVYLGGFDTADSAARAYDRAAIKFRGVDADINFEINDYDEDMEQTKNLTKEEFVHVLRRQSNGFARGSSKYRGVTLHKCGRWEARMSQFLGKKAYDKAAMTCNGKEAVTNFGPYAYEGEVVPNISRQGSGHNLDLNLWISPPSGDSNMNDNGSKLQHYHHVGCEMPDGKRPKVESSASVPMRGQSLNTLAMASKHPSSVWPPGIFPGFIPNYEGIESAKKKGEEAVPMGGYTNWPWQMNGYDVATSVVPVLSAAAASSGFSTLNRNVSTTTTTLVPPLVKLNHHNPHPHHKLTLLPSLPRHHH